MALNVSVNAVHSCNPYELLAWLNETLQTDFTKVEQVCTGAAYCQLMDWLFPGSLDLSRVQFQSNNIVDFIHNYSLLQAAFHKVGVVQYIPTDELIKRNCVAALKFLQWFKQFFDKHNNGKEYHAMEARWGQSMFPAESGRNTVDKGSQNGFCSRETLVHFIKKYFGDNVDMNSTFSTSTNTHTRGPLVSDILGPTHPKDIIQACSHTPYCLYLYMGVELGEGQRTSVVLVSYLDKISGVSVVRLLQTLQMRDSDAHLLIQTVKKLGLSLSNLAVFYCNARHPVDSQVFVSQLQALNPRLLSLCGLPGMAGRACQSGVLASFICVVDLIRDIHHHYSTCLSVNDSLKELFAGSESYNPSHPISAQCLFIINTVQKIVSSWRDLLEYFNSLRQSEDVVRIRAQLVDYKIKLYFLFLSHALEPLRALQELQHYGTAEVVLEFQLTSMLIHSYAASILRPSVAERFLRRHDLHLLHNEKDLLPAAEVNIGSRARDFLWASTTMDLGEQERSNFLNGAVAFYIASLQSLVQSIPQQFGDVALKNIGIVLKHPENINVRRFFFIYILSILSETEISSANITSFSNLMSLQDFPLLAVQILCGMRPSSTLCRLLLTLLALPSSLCRMQGEIVWGKVEGFSPWPALIADYRSEANLSEKRLVGWYGQKMFSQVSLQALKSFAAFGQHFCSNSFAVLATYREAIFLSLQEAALRCKKQFSACLEDKDELLKQMLDWAFGGFQPTGPDGFKPTTSINDGERERKIRNKWHNFLLGHSFASLLFPPNCICRCVVFSGFCLCCGTENIEIFHPLFKGSLCLKCKNNFTETLYRYDEDGYQSYCTICCYGLEVILCGNDGCCRSYCEDCLNILVGPGTFDSLKLLDPWICYLCQQHQPHGALIPREDWSIRVQELFANHSAMEFEPHRVYPSIPASLRRPLRVLSLFDGIATGYLVLKDLGFKVEKYVASEVCEDSIAVADVNHDGKIIHVGDARLITQDHLKRWGPFDLLIGGSPCNDLSIVNPFRKGLYEGTGRLFFEYYRILQLLKPKEGDPRPFFWLFENVVFMNTHDKVNICRFLECNPVLVDAVRVSPAHRARYFWGNIPGMSRPIIASQSDKLSLQDCLEIGREARVTKVRTITTNPNSLKQGKDVTLLPVLHNNKEDNLWITELEKIFGFPKHYTDVRNMNRQQRQKVLGKAWSVPVIRHLFAPLKEYFACEELAVFTTSSTSNSNSSTLSSSPASQD
uniref:DNA (cytosine-5-)-methyltransferase n=1 Tax=Mastacembelus armatus TaxID=205130 RepID=A0A7N8WIR9_9TELE